MRFGLHWLTSEVALGEYRRRGFGKLAPVKSEKSY